MHRVMTTKNQKHGVLIRARPNVTPESGWLKSLVRLTTSPHTSATESQPTKRCVISKLLWKRARKTGYAEAACITRSTIIAQERASVGAVT